LKVIYVRRGRKAIISIGPPLPAVGLEKNAAPRGDILEDRQKIGALH
jgi:hypothetical protein